MVTYADYTARFFTGQVNCNAAVCLPQQEVVVGLSVTARNAMQVSEGIWLVEMPPNQVRFLGECRKAEGERSVLLLNNPQFDSITGSLTFDASGAVPLNIGASNTVVAVRSKAPSQVRLQSGEKLILDSGDKEFLSELDRLPKDLASAAKILLTTVRNKYPGDLRPAKLGRYVNAPDNFWTVKVQPRVANLALTVRGAPERFGKSSLEVKQDQHGYSRFWFRSPNDLQEVLRLIFAAQKRN